MIQFKGLRAAKTSKDFEAEIAKCEAELAEAGTRLDSLRERRREAPFDQNISEDDFKRLGQEIAEASQTVELITEVLDGLRDRHEDLIEAEESALLEKHSKRTRVEAEELRKLYAQIHDQAEALATSLDKAEALTDGIKRANDMFIRHNRHDLMVTHPAAALAKKRQDEGGSPQWSSPERNFNLPQYRPRHPDGPVYQHFKNLRL